MAASTRMYVAVCHRGHLYPGPWPLALARRILGTRWVSPAWPLAGPGPALAPGPLAGPGPAWPLALHVTVHDQDGSALALAPGPGPTDKCHMALFGHMASLGHI